MNSIKLKTNINCSACLARVIPSLNELAGVNNWSVDINNPDKILEVKTDILKKDDVISTLKNVGFIAESL
jgi:copper chaperone